MVQALAEMYVQGVSTRKVKAITEELCGHEFWPRRSAESANSCLRLIRALAVEMHANWIEAIRYLNMEYLRENKKEALSKIQAA